MFYFSRKKYVLTHRIWEHVAHEPGPDGEVEGGEDQGVVEGVPGGQGVEEPVDHG